MTILGGTLGGMDYSRALVIFSGKEALPTSETISPVGHPFPKCLGGGL